MPTADNKFQRLTRQLEAAQAARRYRVYKWVENHGAKSAGEKFGMSRQRAHQLWKKERARLAKEGAGK